MYSDAYSKPSQTTKIERFCENKTLILDVWHGSKYFSRLLWSLSLTFLLFVAHAEGSSEYYSSGSGESPHSTFTASSPPTEDVERMYGHLGSWSQTSIMEFFNLFCIFSLLFLIFLGWLAHLVSRFACKTRMIVDASSSPSVFYSY